jgi:outer membrane protein assembly factor BamE (lipoprotein component of BamABCDE complex)
MLDDLQKRHMKIGMTEQEVLQLLGEPWARVNNEFRYAVGVVGAYDMDYSDFTIWFNKERRVEKFGIVQG